MLPRPFHGRRFDMREYAAHCRSGYSLPGRPVGAQRRGAPSWYGRSMHTGSKPTVIRIPLSPLTPSSRAPHGDETVATVAKTAPPMPDPRGPPVGPAPFAAVTSEEGCSRSAQGTVSALRRARGS